MFKHELHAKIRQISAKYSNTLSLYILFALFYKYLTFWINHDFFCVSVQSAFVSLGVVLGVGLHT